MLNKIYVFDSLIKTDRMATLDFTFNTHNKINRKHKVDFDQTKFGIKTFPETIKNPNWNFLLNKRIKNAIHNF